MAGDACSAAKESVIDLTVVFEAVLQKTRIVAHLHREKSPISHDVAHIFQRPVRVIVRGEIAVFFRNFDKAVDVSRRIASLFLRTELDRSVELLIGHVFDAFSRIADDRRIVRILGEEIDVNFRIEFIVEVVEIRANIRLVSGQHQKIFVRKIRMIEGMLMVGDGEDAVAVVFVGGFQLLRSEFSVREDRVTMQIRLELPFLGRDQILHQNAHSPFRKIGISLPSSVIPVISRSSLPIIKST